MTAVNISIDDLERAAAPGWRAFEEDRLGDWLLRAAEGAAEADRHIVVVS